MKEFYYYYRSKNGNHPRMSICLIVWNSYECSRGVALCSKLDAINKRKGKSLARGRAIRAKHMRCDTLPIKSINGVDIVMSSLASFVHRIKYKSEYNPTLTNYENEILRKIRLNETKNM